MAADRADEEILKATSFTKGEWGDVPIALAMDYGMVAETFGTAAAPLATMTLLALLALAFVTGGLDHALTGRPDDLLTAWEAAITARGAQAAGGDAAANARATAMASCTSEVERMGVHAVRRVEERLRNGSAASDAGAKPRFGQAADRTPPNPGAPVPPLVPPAKIFKWRLVLFSLFYIRKVIFF